MNDCNDLIAAYSRYGFTLARQSSGNDVLVFTLKTGYFDNAEIVKLDKNADTDELFKEFSSAGYACTIRHALSPEKAEEELFNGFFSVDATRARLSHDYKRFTDSLVKPYGDKATYHYINTPYQINGKIGERTAPEEILSRIGEEKPILFLIEAAAGFGKTCTAQEISNIINTKTSLLPLYAELSRNRQARIFRYILLDEIDRTFPLLSSTLVKSEIKNGRISVILDGFDELLRKGEEEGDFNNKEPMLETISELLTGKSKVVITTRRTVLFDGDEFHQWLDSHVNDFSIIRIRIQEPKIKDWLPYDRIEKLRNVGINIEGMSNPVLLSYLRCINEERFERATENPEEIVQSYFLYMLERERERQDLRMDVANQEKILESISGDMIKKGYTSEGREYIVKIILENALREIDIARNQYSSTDRPSREEIANKLASHALLDRNNNTSNKIGFVNEFSLGNYVAKNIIDDGDWLGDDLRFIEPAVKSYAPRTTTTRRTLYNALEQSLPFLNTSDKIEIMADLITNIPEDLHQDAAESIEINDVAFGENKINFFQFTDSVFKKCIFIKSGLSEVTFLNCKFFDCSVESENILGPVYVLGCTSDPDISDELAYYPLNHEDDEDNEYIQNIIEKDILRRFWPVGEDFTSKPSRPVYKPLKHLCNLNSTYKSNDLYACVDNLLKEGILIEINRDGLITLNIDCLNKVNAIFEAK